jgi:hypothetical protein
LSYSSVLSEVGNFDSTFNLLNSQTQKQVKGNGSLLASNKQDE